MTAPTESVVDDPTERARHREIPSWYGICYAWKPGHHGEYFVNRLLTADTASVSTGQVDGASCRRYMDEKDIGQEQVRRYPHD